MPFPDDADFDKICPCFINPVTACGFIDICLKRGDKVMIQDAACSSLGKMVVRLAEKNGIQTINIVRREEQVE